MPGGSAGGKIPVRLAPSHVTYVPPHPPPATSPLNSDPEPPEVHAYELKFVIDAAQAARVTAWAGERLETPTGVDVETTLLFLDTAGLDVARKTGGLKRERFRVRRAGDASTVALERKTRKKDKFKLRADAVPLDDLARLSGADLDLAWPGHRFHRHVLEHALKPACRVSYRRTSFANANGEGRVRVALDCGLRGAPEATWSMAPVTTGDDILAGRVLLEVRFEDALPAALRHLVTEMRLSPSSFSKYRRSLAAFAAIPEASR